MMVQEQDQLNVAVTSKTTSMLAPGPDGSVQFDIDFPSKD